MSYAEEIIANLNHLRTVAALHPRLAMVGVESELENLLRDTLPPPLVNTWETYEDEDFPNDTRRQYEIVTTLIRRELRALAKWDDLRSELKDFIEQLRGDAGESRHERPRFGHADLEKALDSAIELIGQLKNRAYEFPCPKCGSTINFCLRQALESEPGSTVTLSCDKCAPRCPTFQLPEQVGEWELPEDMEIAVKPLAYMLRYLVAVMDQAEESEDSVLVGADRVLQIKLEARTE